MRSVAYPLFITFAVQCFTAFATVCVPVLIPALARDVGIASSFAGVVTGTIYAGAVITAYLGSARVTRIGSIRSCQSTLVIVGAGLALCAAGRAEALVLGGLAIGLGMGPVAAATTSLLTRFAPAHLYGFVFSMSRISMPIGAALAAVALPVLSHRIGWQGALLGSAGVALLLALLLQAARGLDLASASSAPRAEKRAWLEPLRTLFADPMRRRLVMAAMVYFAAQSCLGSFTVAFLVDAMGRSHVEAGAVLAVAQMAGVGARLVFGLVLDRVTRRMALCGSIGLLIAIATGAAAFAQPGWPPVTWTVIFGLYGAGALGWNGVVLAVLAQSGPRERAGEVVGTFSWVTFLGAILGPMLFSLLLAATGYAGSFGLIAVASAAAALALIWSDRRRTGGHPGAGENPVVTKPISAP